jgi:hypothetical protein
MHPALAALTVSEAVWLAENLERIGDFCDDHKLPFSETRTHVWELAKQAPPPHHRRLRRRRIHGARTPRS